MKHPTIDFLGASPDGICSKYKYDKKSKSKYVGRMLEIKCPYSRTEWKLDNVEIINFNPKEKMVICPIYYWVQVQLQLECCDLEECDFWQCEIREYDSRAEFLYDTDQNEPFRSKKFGLEKGCIIQLLPRNVLINKFKDRSDPSYLSAVWNKSKFIYPSKIEMSPYDCDLWVSEQMDIISTDKQYIDYALDRVIYWRLEFSKCTLFQRDRKWFAESLPTFQRMWNYVEFLRSNKMQLDIFKEYIETIPIKRDKDIMNMVTKLCNPDLPNYEECICLITDEIAKNRVIKKEKYVNKQKSSYSFTNYNSANNPASEHVASTDCPSGYMFVDDTPIPTETRNPIKSEPSDKKPKSSLPLLPTSYMFTDN